MRAPRAGLALLSMICALACSKPDDAIDAGAQPSAASAPAPVASSPPLSDLPDGRVPVTAAQADSLVPRGQVAVSLVGAGEPPRTPLRLPTGARDSKRVELVVDVTLSVALRSQAAVRQPVPPMKLALDLAVSAGEGPSSHDAALQVTIAELSLAPRGGPEQGIAKAMGAVVAKMRGLRWSIPFGERGLLSAATMPKDTPQEVLQLWTTIDEALRDALVPLPIEPVGAGASWRVFDRHRRAGVELLRRSTFKLVKRDEKVVTLMAEVREVAVASPPGSDPAVPKELLIRVLEGSSEGKRDVVRRVGEIVPMSSESNIVSRLSTDTRLARKPDEAGKQATLSLEQTLRMAPAGVGNTKSPGPTNPPDGTK